MPQEAQIKVRLLGGFEVQRPNGGPVEIATRKAQCLFAYLAFYSNEAHSRGKLVGLFWPGSDEKRAQGSLRQALTYIRKAAATTGQGTLVSDRGDVKLDAGVLDTDAVRFLRLAESEIAADLEAAIELYKGDLLQGISLDEPEFESWLEGERWRLRDCYGQCLTRLLVAKRRSGDDRDALKIAQRLLVLDPLQEGVHRALIELYAKLDMRGTALEQYEKCRALLQQELGVAPEAETIALYERLRRSRESPGQEVPPIAPIAASAQLPSEPMPSASGRGFRWNQMPLLAVLAIGLAAVFGVGIYLLTPTTHSVEPASPSRMAFPIPSGPSIAVLPFANLSGDSDQDYFADGITDDLITDLSKIPNLFVIARNSTFVYKGQDVPISKVAEDLGVRYVLEGSIRPIGGKLRINAQLIDATTGSHLWAERYDGPPNDVIALQDQVTGDVATSLQLEISNREEERLGRQATSNPEAYDAVLRARAHMRRFTREDFAIALPYLEKAIRLDPSYARAHTLLGSLLIHISGEEWERSFGWTRDETLVRGRRHLDLGLKEPSSVGLFVLTKTYSNEGRYDDAILEAEKMVALNANDVLGYEALGRALNKAGRAEEAIEPLRMAIRLDPRGDDKGWLSYRMGEAYYLSGHYQEAVKAFARSVERNHNEWAYFFLAASLGQVDALEAAREALANFERIRAEAGEDPYTLARLETWAFKKDTDRKQIQEGLRKAGMPEGAMSNSDFGLAQDVTPETVSGASTVDAATAQELLARGAKLVDVRDRADWVEGHIPGAQHIYLYGEFTPQSLASVAGKEEELVLFAEGVGASSMAARAAARAVSWGYQKVYYFRDGFPGWRAAGYPIRVAQD